MLCLWPHSIQILFRLIYAQQQMQIGIKILASLIQMSVTNKAMEFWWWHTQPLAARRAPWALMRCTYISDAVQRKNKESDIGLHAAMWKGSAATVLYSVCLISSHLAVSGAKVALIMCPLFGADNNYLFRAHSHALSICLHASFYGDAVACSLQIAFNLSWMAMRLSSSLPWDTGRGQRSGNKWGARWNSGNASIAVVITQVSHKFI